jgi:hypothetical protein
VAIGPAVARRQHDGGGRGRLGPVGNAAWRRSQRMGCGTAGDPRRRTEQGGRMGTATQRGNNAASIGAHG